MHTPPPFVQAIEYHTLKQVNKNEQLTGNIQTHKHPDTNERLSPKMKVRITPSTKEHGMHMVPMSPSMQSSESCATRFPTHHCVVLHTLF